MSYNFKTVEKKWQTKWEKEGTFNAKNDYTGYQVIIFVWWTVVFGMADHTIRVKAD